MLRWFLRNVFVQPFIWLNYKVTIRGGAEALSATNGAIIVANHISRIDGPFIVSVAWPYARIRPTAWHAEYTHFLQWPVMKLFGTVCLGSPKQLPEGERRRRKEKAIDIMKKILDAGRYLLIFAEGGISDGTRVTIKPHLSGVYELIAAHKDTPVLFVRISGLEYSAFGKRSVSRSFFRRLPVSVAITRVDNVSLEGGPPGLNARMEQFYNENGGVECLHDKNILMRESETAISMTEQSNR